MLKVNLSSLKLNKIYIRLVSSSVVAVVGLVGGITPEISMGKKAISSDSLSSISFSTIAYAQQFTSEEIANYAKAGYQVELLRRQAYKEIKTIMNEPPGDIVCNQEETQANLDPKVRQITERFCNQILQIPQQNNLSVARYNELKTYYERKDDFYQQVQGILLKLQN